ESQVIIEGFHTNIVFERFNDEILLDKRNENEEEKNCVELSFDKIYDFAKNTDYLEIKDVLDQQISYNYNVAKEGIENDWGCNIGKLVLDDASEENFDKFVAYAAAGSDARMSGCEKPVIINSGSGNQGLTVSVPIIVYCRDNNIEDEKLYRALIFANLLGLYIKQGIGELSAYCGVVTAGASSVCGIA